MSKRENKATRMLLAELLQTFYGQDDTSDPSPPSSSGHGAPAEPGAVFDLKKEFVFFLAKVPAARLNRYLRKLLMDYLYYRTEELPDDFKEGLHDLYWLMDLLDKIHRKTPKTLHGNC